MQRWLGVSLVGLVVGGGGCFPTEACDEVVECTAVGVDEIGALTCGNLPHLCGLSVQSTVHQPDLERAVDVVFLGEGYTTDELDAYREQVRRLIAEVSADREGIVARAPYMFNFHRVDLPSETARICNGDRLDTALAGCIKRSESDVDDRLMLRALDTLVAFATRQNTPDADVAVVLFNSDAGAACASGVQTLRYSRGGFVFLGSTDDGRVLTHELGHALFALGDEYGTRTGACYEPSTMERALDLVEPNLSIDATGSKWRSLVTDAVAGGSGYDRCIFHPTHSCRMSDQRSRAFCPVCRATINAGLAGRWRENDGPPRCRLAGKALANGRGVRVRMRVIDREPPVKCILDLGGSSLFTFQSETALLESTREVGWPHGRGADASRLRLTCEDRDGQLGQGTGTLAN